jgi:hypothetical protein
LQPGSPRRVPGLPSLVFPRADPYPRVLVKPWLYLLAFLATVANLVVLAWREPWLVACTFLALLGVFGLYAWIRSFAVLGLALRRFRAEHEGRDVLLVTSDSPRWQAYIAENWSSRWGHRAVTINWSERRLWGPRRQAGSAVALFREVGGVFEYCPLVVIVPPKGRKLRIFRFYQAFRDRKHGKEQRLHELEAEVERHLGGVAAPLPPPPEAHGSSR